MNINMGRHLTHLAFDEWDGAQQPEKNSSFEIRVQEGTNEVMVFAPTLPGECWEILILKYGGAETPISKALRSQIDWLAKRLYANVTEEQGE